ncbi:MAG: hypothetical protein P8X78_05105, partial [Nitrosopumilaceae archaeon]
ERLVDLIRTTEGDVGGVVIEHSPGKTETTLCSVMIFPVRATPELTPGRLRRSISQNLKLKTPNQANTEMWI